MSRVSETVDALGENTFDLAAGSPFSQPFFWQVTSCHRFGTTALAKINYLKTTLSDRRAISVIVRKGEDDESTLDCCGSWFDCIVGLRFNRRRLSRGCGATDVILNNRRAAASSVLMFSALLPVFLIRCGLSPACALGARIQLVNFESKNAKYLSREEQF